MSNTSSTPDDPDLAILLVAAARVLADRLAAAHAAAGVEVRPSWGYVVRALYAGPLALAQLAQVLGVTKQAAQQTVDDMASAGLVTRTPDPADGRRKLLALTDAGRAVRARALAASAELERELRREHGDAALTALRDVLTGMVARHGDLEDLRALRARAL